MMLPLSQPPEIQPEEVLQDAVARTSWLEEHKLESPVNTKRLLGIAIVMAAALGILVWRLTGLQILPSSSYRHLSASLHERRSSSEQLRGIIKDRNDTILAFNVPTMDVWIDPHRASKKQDDLREQLSNVLVSGATTLEDIDRILVGNQPSPVAYDITREQALDLSSSWFAEHGVAVRSSSRRHYPFGSVAAHLLGYIGSVDQQDLRANSLLSLTDRIGKMGVEQAFDAILSYRTDSDHERRGGSIRLTVDARLQQLLHEAVRDIYGNRRMRGAAVILDPRDGSIRAVASFPGFDNNDFAHGIAQDAYRTLINDSSQPLFNRAVAGQYPPASTIKPFIATAALEEDIVTPSFTVNVTGAISIPSRYDPNVVYTFRDWKAHGRTDLRKAIAVSSNVYFYILGGGYRDIIGLGIERIASWLQTFGFGRPTGIELEGEAAGLVPTPQWKQETKNNVWRVGDTYHTTIGQGDLQVTPMQMARATAAIANDGTLPSLRLLDAVLDERGDIVQQSPAVSGEALPVDMKTLAIVREGMRQAVTEGSARRLSALPVAVAGKTGTGEVGGDREPHSWFTGFFPYNNPEFVITVILENAGESTTAAVPVVEYVIEKYYANDER